MHLDIEANALAWLKNKKIHALTIKEIEASGGCCSGPIREILIDKGAPTEKRESYRQIDSHGIEIYIAGNITKKTDKLKIVLSGLIIKKLNIEGYDPMMHTST